MAAQMPMSDEDTVDIVGIRKDGGLDMVVSAAGPIDDSPETLRLLENKLKNYIMGANSEAFPRHYGRSPGVPVVIYISCTHPISPAAIKVIDRLRASAAENGVGLEIRRQMETSH